MVRSYYFSNSNRLLISNNEYCICKIVKVDITRVASKLVKEVAVFESLRSFIPEKIEGVKMVKIQTMACILIAGIN